MSHKKLKNNQIVVLGYGSQGRAIALNLRDSGCEVIIGLKTKSPSRRLAKKDGFEQILTSSEAVKKAKYIFMALPDHLQGKVFENDIKKNLNDNSTLVFLHGFAIHFGFIKPLPKGDVVMIAPHAPGTAVREKYLTDRSLSAFYAVFQDYSERALPTVFRLAKWLGFRRRRLIETTFENEAVGDLFGEQTVLCGGLAELIQNGFEVLVENGLPPENAYLEVAYQLDLIVQLIKKYGINGMYQHISVAARYGSFLSGEKVIDKSVKKRMEEVFEDIRSGEFAKKLNDLSDKELAELKKSIIQRVNPAFEKAARKFSK